MDAAQFSDDRRRGRKVKVMLLFACLWGLTSLSCAAAGRLPLSRQKLKVEKLLKRLNKPPIKTINSPDGDIIDCVHISHQPAFDHPFLKDHKIQVRPSCHPGLYDDEKNDKMSSSSSSMSNKIISQPWHAVGECPEDTIPIRRTKKEDVVRASSVNRYGKKRHGSIPKPFAAAPQNLSSDQIAAHQHAIAFVEDTFYGVKASINVWQPKVQVSDEFSISQIWLLAGPSTNHDSIEAGWQVNPSLYADNRTRFFTYWTSDGYQTTGCYNLLCSGFVQINNKIAMGAAILPISQPDEGNSGFEITLLIWKDQAMGNWWIQFGNETVLGYWPSSLFSYLADSASLIQLGGEIINSSPDGHHTFTQMGSGSFPENKFASYIRNIQVVDDNNYLNNIKGLSTYTDNQSCYDIQIKEISNEFSFGGSGRNVDCN